MGEERRSYDADIAVIKDNMKDVKEQVKEIHEVLTKDGLITTVALNKQTINRLVAWLMLISGGMAGAFWKMFK